MVPPSQICLDLYKELNEVIERGHTQAEFGKEIERADHRLSDIQPKLFAFAATHPRMKEVVDEFDINMRTAIIDIAREHGDKIQQWFVDRKNAQAAWLGKYHPEVLKN